MLGLDASRCGVLWLKRAGLLAYPAANTLVLFDLATKQQSLLSHHRQGIGALAVSSDGGLLATGSIAPEPAGVCVGLFCCRNSHMLQKCGLYAEELFISSWTCGLSSSKRGWGDHQWFPQRGRTFPLRQRTA